MNQHLLLHAIAVKKHADAQAIAQFCGFGKDETAKIVADCVKSGRVVEVQGKYVLAPLARVALEGQYGALYQGLRGSTQFMKAYEDFERINVQLKKLITDWQTIEVAGARIANNHTDEDYDLRIIGRLGDLHERAEQILTQLMREVPRFAYYKNALLFALERAERGEKEWVSDARIPSYHTVWFELHEDLLRLVGRQRQE